jgi:quinol monooxygenase YgiN
VETQVARREEATAERERRLAEDWTNADVLAEHRRARDELQALLERWETLFEAAK